MRLSGREALELRKVRVTPNFIKQSHGSVLFEMGNTRVICTANLNDSVPHFLEGKGTGWLTAEYSMLPGSTRTRKQRESHGRVSGRTHEIQRLIGRSLRAVCDLKKLGERTLYLDCDVIEADGGTRTASITGAFMALSLACKQLVNQGRIPANPIMDQVAAVSVGLHQGSCFLDLDFAEDSKGDVDMNIVMTGDGRFIEIQGTAEGEPFSLEDQKRMLEAAEVGIRELTKLQRDIIEKAG